MKKRILAMVLSAAMMVSLFPLGIFAEDPVQEQPSQQVQQQAAVDEPTAAQNSGNDFAADSAAEASASSDAESAADGQISDTLPPPEGVAEQKPAASKDSQPADAAANSEQPAVCTCTEPCSEESQNAECPVCSSDFALCKAKGEQSEPEASDTEPTQNQQDSTEASEAKPTLLAAEDEGLLPTAEEVKNPAAKIGENVYATLAEAIKEATDGDTITLLRDLDESVTIESKQNLTLKLNGYTLSGTAENSPVIAVNNSDRLTVTGGTITGGTGSGIRIKNGYDMFVKLTDVTVSGNHTANCGGGIYLEGPEAEPAESEQFPVLSLTGSTTISDNKADLNGGGIYAKHARVNLNGRTVESNRSGCDGGGVYVENGFLQLFQATVNGNRGIENGGGIAMKNCGFDIAVSEIYENEAKNGGGVAILGSDTKSNSHTIHEAVTTIHDNTAKNNGGGIYAQDAEFQLTSPTIENNTAAQGGGVYANRSTVTVEGSTIQNNKTTEVSGYETTVSTGAGGGVYVRDGALTIKASTIKASTIQGNTATRGGGVYADHATVMVEGSTIQNNMASDVPSDSPTSNHGLGGGIYSFDCTLTITDSTITGNEACGSTSLFRYNTTENTDRLVSSALGNGGGGICAVGKASNVTLSGVTVTENKATFSSSSQKGVGAGIDAEGGALTVKESNVNGNNARGNGGGIFSAEGNVLNVSDTTIQGNQSNNGGGISVGEKAVAPAPSQVTITDTKILDNKSTLGGGAYISNCATAALTNCTVAGNKATLQGGGICSYLGIITLDNVTVERNEASDATNSAGGGVYLLGNQSSAGSLTLKNGTAIQNNSAVVNGGGIYLQGKVSLRSDGTEDCKISIANNTAANGGGIFATPWPPAEVPYTLNLALTNTDILNNSATYGGGMYLLNSGNATIQAELQNSSIDGNKATGWGGGIFAYAGATLTVNHTSISKNTASTAGGLLLWKGSSAVLTSGKICNNTAQNGGGVYATENSALRMDSGSISGNTAASSGGGLFADGTSTSQLTGGDVYNNHAGTAGDDLYLLSTATGTTLLRAADTNWILSDCSHNIDGWYLDGKDARWNADAANAETYYVINLEKQVDGTAVVKNDDGSYTLTGAIALKAAHGLSGYTVRYLEKDTNKELHEAKQVENQPLGTEVKESALDISGYDQVAPTQVSITISADSEKNVITFYYTLHRSSGGHTSTPEPDPDPTPTPTPVPPVVVPSTPAPTTPVRRITPAAQPTPAPTAAPTAQPADSQPAKAESEPEVIEADETPLAPMAGGAWALVNLILMLLTVLASLLLLLGYLGKKKYAKEDEYGNALHDANGNEIIDYTRNKKGFWRVASLIPAVAAVIAFVLTENMRLPMIMVDRWTLLMVIIAVVQLIVAVLCKKKKESEEDENEANI